MLDYITEGENYKVKFNGKHSEFVTYLKSISNIYNKRYDVDNQRWILNQNAFHKLKNLCYNENSAFNIPSKKISEEFFKDIGIDLKLEPYGYQKEASYYSTKQKNCIFKLPCGAGKSMIGLCNYHQALLNKSIKNANAMFVVKSTAKKQWLLEVEKFTEYEAVAIHTLSDLKAICSFEKIETKLKKIINHLCLEKTFTKHKEQIIHLLESKNHEELFRLQFELADIVIVTYSNLTDEKINAKLHDKEIDFIYADEIHLIKGKDNVRTKALISFNNASVKSGATATIVKKNPEDVYSIFQFINPDLFKHKDFTKRYLIYSGYGRVVGGKNLEELNKTIAPYIFSKTDEEVSSQLPEQVIIQKYASFNNKQQEISDLLLEELNELKDREITLRKSLHSEYEAKNNPELDKITASIMARQTFSQELTVSEKLFELSESDMAKKYITGEDDNKIELLIELMTEILESEEKVVVFSRYEKAQKLITERIEKERKKEIWKDVKIAYISGKLNANKRFVEYNDKFTNDENYKILLCSDAGSESINLPNCKHLIELDPADSVLTQTQRRGRITRASSVHKTVFVWQLLMNDSYDDIALKIINKKKEYDKQIIG